MKNNPLIELHERIVDKLLSIVEKIEVKYIESNKDDMEIIQEHVKFEAAKIQSSIEEKEVKK